MKCPKTKQERNSEETLRMRYDIYTTCANDGKGMDITTGSTRPIKTFDQWLNN